MKKNTRMLLIQASMHFYVKVPKTGKKQKQFELTVGFAGKVPNKGKT
jgi:hypothetical protein